MLGFLDKYRDLGLLVMRAGLGVAFVMHGWPKLAGGSATWAKVGGAMKNIGISFAPEMWGLLAALSETLGGVLIAIGLFFRPAAVFLCFTMIIATLSKFAPGASFKDFAHPLEMAIVFFGLIFVGPGKFVVRKD